MSSLPKFSLDVLGTRRALRHAGHPFATMSNSWLRYPTGCWAGPQFSISTPKAIPRLSSTYRLNGVQSESSVLGHLEVLVYSSGMQFENQIPRLNMGTCFMGFLHTLIKGSCDITIPCCPKMTKAHNSNPISYFKLLDCRKASTGLIFSSHSFCIPLDMLRPKYFTSSLQRCALDVENS